MGRRVGAALAAAVLGAVAVSASACSHPAAGASNGRIAAVGAENQYADVISQIGGRYVSVTAILSNPNTDPHTFEVSPKLAETVSSAQLVVQNGLGYDPFMRSIENATSDPADRVIEVQQLLGLPASTPNPHLWYDPATMPAVAAAVGHRLSVVDPAHRTYFRAAVARFDRSLRPWRQAIARLRADFGGAPVATTEPVADDLLEAAGLANRSPMAFQEDVMNGVDPSPQAVADEQRLLTDHRVNVLVYNQQVTDALTGALLQAARHAHIPVVGVYETMPTPGFRYQSWMTAEVHAVQAALATGVSAPAAVRPDGGAGDAEPTGTATMVTEPTVAVAATATAGGGDVRPGPREVVGLEDVDVWLGGRQVLHQVSFAVGAGQLCGLIGANGAGKTTIMRVVMGMQPVTAGTVRVGGQAVGRRNHLVGYVPQKVVIDPDVPVRARDLVALGLDGEQFGFRRPSRARRDAVDEMLSAVGADRFADARLGSLSGGEQQRVLIAHALVARPPLLCMDEPLANLDISSGQEIVALLAKLCAEHGVAVLVSAHDVNPLLPVMDRVVYVADGRAAAGTTAEVVRTEVLSALYRHPVHVVEVEGRMVVVAAPADYGHEHDHGTEP